MLEVIRLLLILLALGTVIGYSGFSLQIAYDNKASNTSLKVDVTLRCVKCLLRSDMWDQTACSTEIASG